MLLFLIYTVRKEALNEFRKRVSSRNPFSANAYLETRFLCVDDILFNFAQSDGLSQANQVNSARNQRLTATVVFLDAGVTDDQSLQAGVIPGVATV